MASRSLAWLAFLGICTSTLGHVVGTGPMDGVEMDAVEVMASRADPAILQGDSAVFQGLADDDDDDDDDDDKGSKSGGSAKTTSDTGVLAKTLMGCGQSGTVSIGKSSSKAFGTFKNYFGLKSGLVISTGHVDKLEKKYDNSKNADNGEGHTKKGEAEDLVTFTLTFKAPRKGFAKLQYIFASQEMPAYFGSKFNDDAQILINGKSVGVLPNGKTLNIKNAGGGAGPKDKDKWIKEFVLNKNLKMKGVPKSIPGYIKLLTAVAPVKAGKNKLTVRIKDKADGMYNSLMFLKGHSFCVKSKPPPLPAAQAKALGIKPVKKKRRGRGRGGSKPCKGMAAAKKALSGAGWCPWDGWHSWK